MDTSRTPVVFSTVAGTLGYVPVSPVPGGTADALVNEAVHALTMLDAATTTIAADQQLSGFGQVAKLIPARKDATIRVGKAWEQLQAYVDNLNKRAAGLMAVPQANAADILLDQELRTRLDDVEETRRAAALALAERGEAPRLALALIRSPFAHEVLDTLPDGVALKAWEATCRFANPSEFEKLDAEQASVEWARPIVQRVAQLVESISNIPMPSGAGLSVRHIIFDNGLRETAYQAWQIDDMAWGDFVRTQTGRAA